ncbi:MAG: hypothetical protein M5U01_03145 [Ardenticatenaceae bacterium]|nr:hypothetical protein [Ardenticatenaceae bacterium]HBY95277.1 hypothetical protein [Chloroflexota bacterium]
MSEFTLDAIWRASLVQSLERDGRLRLNELVSLHVDPTPRPGVLTLMQGVQDAFTQGFEEYL